MIRNEKGLKFQTDGGEWHEISEPNAMVNLYIPQFHVFVLKYLSTENCELYGIYDPKADKLERLEGQFFLHPNQNNFAILPNPKCAKKAKIGRFLKGKGTLIKEIDTKFPISSIKWNKEEYAFLVKNGDSENFVYRKLP